MGPSAPCESHCGCLSTTSFALTTGLTDWRFVRWEIVQTYQR